MVSKKETNRTKTSPCRRKSKQMYKWSPVRGEEELDGRPDRGPKRQGFGGGGGTDFLCTISTGNACHFLLLLPDILQLGALTH